MGKGDATRGTIVETALDLAREIGLEAVTLGVLAARLQLSKSGLFAHFRSKEALQLAVVAAAVARFRREVVRPALARPAAGQLSALFDGYLAWMDRGRGGCLFLALAQEYDDRPGPVRGALVHAQADWRRLLSRSARRGAPLGVDPDQLAFELMGIAMAYQHAVKLWGDPEARQRARLAFERLGASDGGAGNDR